MSSVLRNSVVVLAVSLTLKCLWSHKEQGYYRSRMSSVGKALDCISEGRGFDSRGRTNTQGL